MYSKITTREYSIINIRIRFMFINLKKIQENKSIKQEKENSGYAGKLK